MRDRKLQDNELTRRLEAYAEAHLSPERSATTRMRAQVMAAANRQAELARAGTDRAAAALQVDRDRRPAWRRPASLLLAAGLTLALGVSSVVAAQPGGPTYGVRIWAETLTLPSGANERAEAELRRLEARLAEAAAAAAAGDTNAANAALGAYGAIVNEAAVAAGGDVSAAATLDAGVRSNIDVLTVLSGKVPEPARDAIQDSIQNAIERSGSALDELHGQPAGGPPDTTPNSAPGSSDHPGPNPNSNKPESNSANPAPRPRPTPQPQSNSRSDARPVDPQAGATNQAN